jgi:hypothetical protein
MVFRLERPFDAREMSRRMTRSSFEEAEVEAAFAHSLRVTPAAAHSGIHAARVMLLVYDGEIDRARELSRRLAGERGLTPTHARAVGSAIERAGHG